MKNNLKTYNHVKHLKSIKKKILTIYNNYR